MHLAGGTFIFLGIVIAWFLAYVYTNSTPRGTGISQHPYRDPYGDAPGASRKAGRSGDERASIDYAPGTR